MTEPVVHELVSVTADEAGRLEEEFLNGLDQAQDAFVRIMETNAWAALGHDSFVAWWEQRVLPTMRALSMRPTPEIAAMVLDRVREQEAALPSAQRRRQAELGELVGVSEATVGRLAGSRSTTATPDANADLETPAPVGEPERDQPEGLALGCESCSAELDVQNAQVGYLRCEDCDSEGAHVSSAFPEGPGGPCVACHPEDPTARAWLARNSPESLLGGTAAEPEPEAAPQPERPVPPRMTERDRREHEESVRRVQDIAAAHRASDSIIHDLRVAMVTIVTGCRYGETGLVTKDMIRQLREIVDQLEGEL
jgi:hypothetical protein